MIYGLTHAEQKISRLIPKRRFAWKFWHEGEFHDGRKFRFQYVWIVQIGRYPVSMGPRIFRKAGTLPLNGSEYVVWGVFLTRGEALRYASDGIRANPWFY